MISVKCSKNIFWSTSNYLTPKTNSTKSIFKQLRAIWNLHFPIISIQISNLKAYISLNIDFFLHIFLRVRLWARLTFSQTLDQVDTWSDKPPRKWFQWNSPKIFLKYTELSNPPKISTEWIFKQLRAIWNLHFLIISIQSSNFIEAYTCLNIDIFYIFFFSGWGFRPGWHFVRCTPPDETSGQVDICSDVPPQMRVQVRLTFSQTLGQVDIWSDFRFVRCTPSHYHQPKYQLTF